MTQVTTSDLQELQKLFETTELIAVGGNQLMNAVPLSTGHTIYYYVVPKSHPMLVFNAHDKIQKGSQWAIIHDYYQSRYELWVEGVKFGSLEQSELIPTLAHCIRDKSYR